MENLTIPSCHNCTQHTVGCVNCQVALLTAFVNITNCDENKPKPQKKPINYNNVVSFLQNFNHKIVHNDSELIQNFKKAIDEHFLRSSYLKNTFYIVINDVQKCTVIVTKNMFRNDFDPTKKNLNGDFMFHPYNWKHVEKFCDNIYILKNEFRSVCNIV